MIVKIIFVYIDDDLYDEDIDNIETLKKIEENRKKRANEGVKLLNKIQ